MPEIYAMPNFVKIVRAVLEIINIYIPTYICIYKYIYINICTILARLIISGDSSNKPAKFGLKFFAIVDSLTFYALKFEIYCGNETAGPYVAPNSRIDTLKG